MSCFVPPFCPNRECQHHHRGEDPLETPPPDGCRWFIRYGHHQSVHCGPVQRYRCLSCRATFSERTFSPHFATHLLLDLSEIASRINSGSGVRSIAGWFGCSDKVITNRLARLGRQAIGVHATLTSAMQLGEDLVADGFESFVVSQYWPNNFTLLAGSRSQFLYSIDYAQLRRKGRKTEAQRQRCQRLYRSFPLPPAQIERSFERISCEMKRLWLECPFHHRGPRLPTRSLALYTDRHQSYSRVIGNDAQLGELAGAGRFVHHRIDSKRARTVDNPLFSVNYLDRQFRKDMGCHTRETVQWNRDVGNAMHRMWLYAVCHNCFKPWRIGVGERRTHAEYAGISENQVRWAQQALFTTRFFFSRVSLSGSQWMSWLGAWATPQKSFYTPPAAYVLA